MYVYVKLYQGESDKWDALSAFKIKLLQSRLFMSLNTKVVCEPQAAAYLG